MGIIKSQKQRIRELERVNKALRSRVIEQEAVSTIAFVTMAEGGTIDETTATEHIGAFENWHYEADYAVGALRKHDGVLYRCIQAHRSQADWSPDVTASLWAVAGNPAEEYPAWSQPVGAHDAYAAGAKVTHNGMRWISTVAANVWEPAVYGWQAVDE